MQCTRREQFFVLAFEGKPSALPKNRVEKVRERIRGESSSKVLPAVEGDSATSLWILDKTDDGVLPRIYVVIGKQAILAIAEEHRVIDGSGGNHGDLTGQVRKQFSEGLAAAKLVFWRDGLESDSALSDARQVFSVAEGWDCAADSAFRAYRLEPTLRVLFVRPEQPEFGARSATNSCHDLADELGLVMVADGGRMSPSDDRPSGGRRCAWRTRGHGRAGPQHVCVLVVGAQTRSNEAAPSDDCDCITRRLLDTRLVSRIEAVGVIGVDNARILRVELRLVQQMASLLHEDYVGFLESEKATPLGEGERFGYNQDAPTEALELWSDEPRP